MPGPINFQNYDQAWEHSTCNFITACKLEHQHHEVAKDYTGAYVGAWETANTQLDKWTAALSGLPGQTAPLEPFNLIPSDAIVIKGY